MREKTLQDRCMELLDSKGIYYINTWGNAHERRGRPDLIICHNGRFIGCELKRPGGKPPEALQQKHLNDITRNGGVGVWITAVEELDTLLMTIS